MGHPAGTAEGRRIVEGIAVCFRERLWSSHCGLEKLKRNGTAYEYQRSQRTD